MKRKKILFAAISLLILVFAVEIWQFIKSVTSELWDSSIRTITETTHQGANALNLQLEMDLDTLEQFWLTAIDSDDPEHISEIYQHTMPDVTLYRSRHEDSRNLPKTDQYVAEYLNGSSLERGIIDSHISSITGENVFNIFVRGMLSDGAPAYLVQEYRTKEIAKQFTLSFYDNTGFSYLINRDGKIMVRPGHKNSNKTVFNIFDMISDSENEPQMIDTFVDSVSKLQTGWARFIYDGTGMVFCYEPLRTDSDWLLVSIIPEHVITEQASSILGRTLLFSGIALVSIVFIIAIFIGIKMHENQEHTHELEVALDAADAANHAKSRFLADMSHDVRTPLNAIIGMTAIARENLDNHERTRDCLDKIRTSGTQLLSLVNDILDMSQIEQGKVILKEEPLQFAQFFEETVHLMKRKAQEVNLTLRTAPVHLANETIIGDPLRIRQILLNLISNAIKYTPSGGTVSLELAELEPTETTPAGYGIYQFRCSDTGIGIEPEFIKRLFLPFERARNTTESKISGTGIGLAVTKSLLDLMDGTIDVESTPGQGSVFTVVFSLRYQETAPDIQLIDKNGPGTESTQVPIQNSKAESLTKDTVFIEDISHTALNASEEPIPNTAPDSESADYSDKHILIVEDNELNMEILEELLDIIGVQTETAINGKEAVTMLTDHPAGYYDLIFMDIQMPVMNGYEATRQIRKLDGCQQQTLPIYAVSANALANDIEGAIESGMNGHIAKPVDLDVLKKVLRQCFG